MEELFRRHAEWQKEQAKLSWTEKMKIAEQLRDAAIAWRKSAPETPDENTPVS